MKNKKFFTYLTIFSIFFVIFASNVKPVKAANYRFEVDYMQANVFIEMDGSITIEYTINFTCKSYGSTIDVVDIGFPNQHYNLSSVEAKIDGKTIASSRIQVSEVIPIGVEIWLDSNSIKKGESAQLWVRGNNPNMVFQDYINQSLASVEFSPTWFDSDFCSKYDYLEVNIYFPPGYSEGNLVKYHYDKFTSYGWGNHRDGTPNTLYYQWTKSNADMKQYMYGVSFPADAIDYQLPWTANPQVVANLVFILTLISGISLLVGFVYFLVWYNIKYKKRYYPPKKRTGGGSFCCVFLAIFTIGFLGIISSVDMGDILIIIGYMIFLIAGFGMIGFLIFKALSRLRLPYSTPNMKIECVGVNKKLTIVEAAIIKNTELSKVIFLIMFGLIRSGHLRVIGIEPIKFEVITTKGIQKMRIYQKRFLKAVRKTGEYKGELIESKLKTLLVNLIKATHKKMKAYELDATMRYYEYMSNEAWETVKKLPNEIKWEDIEEEFDWLVIDDMFEKRSERYLVHRYYYRRPYWYDRFFYHHYYWGRGHYRNYYPRRRVKSAPMKHLNIHTFSDSIARGLENISNTIVKNFSEFAESVIGTVRPAPTGGGGGRSYGGGGCACACACAGCACACAGGGR